MEQGARSGAPLNTPTGQPTNIRAIETSYRGYRFRSRLEARWAVFYDAMQIEWQYEPEGFELPSGRYLPDFFLPAHNVWVEIKGSKPTARESRLACEMAHYAAGRDGGRFRLFAGDIPRNVLLTGLGINFVPGIQCSIGPTLAIPMLRPVPDYILLIGPDGPAGREDLDAIRNGGAPSMQHAAKTPVEYWHLQPALWGIGWSSMEEIQAALNEARSARFEHGETGRRK